MNKTKLLLAVIPVLLSRMALAQTNGGTGKGLDKLDERDVMTLLAGNNLNTLLAREFELYKVTPAEQDQLATLPLLQQLANPVGLTVAKRRELAVKVANGLANKLSKASDSASLLEQANLLFLHGVQPDQNELEFFGENPVAQAQLKPVAETTKRMFVQAGQLAEVESKALGNQVKTPQDYARLKPRIDKMKLARFTATYTDNMATYPLCLSLPKEDPQRKELTAKAIEYLTQFDNPDSTVQSVVRLQIGKMQLVAGDYDKAKATLDTIVDNPDKAIKPSPDLPTQNNARYFGIVAEIMARKLKAAETDIGTFESWENSVYLSSLNPVEQNQVKAAMSMMKFRLYSAQSDQSNDDQIKKDTNDKAIDTLAMLLKDQPSLKDLVYDQLVGRIPANPDLTTMNPLILQGLRQQGFYEMQKKGDEKVDAAKLSRAIDAAKEIVNRKGKAGIDNSDVDRSAYFLGYAYERLDQTKLAAGAFLNYAESFKGNKDWAEDAMDHATKWIGVLRTKDAEDADTRALYDRFLPTAINPPFNRKNWAFRYATLLREEGKFKESVDYFKRVTPDDKHFPEAQYKQLVAMTQELGTTGLAAEARKEIAIQILALDQTIDGFLISAANADDKKIYSDWVVNSDEIAADVARKELKDPAKSLQILNGFEERIAGAKDPKSAHLYAMQIRIGAFMDSGDLDQATKALFTLLAVDEGAGQGLMFQISHTIDRDMDAAKAAGNVDEQKKLAMDQAQLSSLILSWASKSKDPKVHAELPNYQRFSADSKRRAAELADNPAMKQKALNDALADYQALNKILPDDPAAQQGIGLVQFDLGNYAEAIKYLSPLVTGKKIGAPTELVGPAEAQHEVENTDFWQANYELVKSMVELAKKEPKDPRSQESLKTANSYVGALYVIHGKKAGGSVYRDDFDKLRAELAQLVKQSNPSR